jgi:hypothetical protein
METNKKTLKSRDRREIRQIPLSIQGKIIKVQNNTVGIS